MADLTPKGGVKLTKQAVDRLAKEAEKGYDLAKATPERIRPGRPSLAGGKAPRPRHPVAPAVVLAGATPLNV